VGYGTAANAIVQIVNNQTFDLLVMGAHGHRNIKDILFGTTVNKVRHQVKIPVLIIN
jgi:manganese transport protein